ncbi:MAG: radical SAM protein [Muribaculaceae bacterium]|nr:radical SAM protein [Muribaculaceae bacterium]
MQTVLFHETIFGPIHSRRLGSSLGINLMPDDGKICLFDCLYCEAGFNAQGPGTTGMASQEKVSKDLENKLAGMIADGIPLDVITFSGNGEPTVHPQFPQIIAEVARLRDKYFPDVKISVLTNSTMVHKPDVAEALKKYADSNILKLDSAVESTMRILDRPGNPAFTVESAIEHLRQFEGTGIIQTMLTRGEHDGVRVDNTTDSEIEALIEAYRKIRPASVMIYSLDRPTPELSLKKVPRAELDEIAGRITAATGIPVQVA